MSLRYTRIKKETLVVFQLQGEFSAGSGGEALFAEVQRSIEADESKLILDFGEVYYINSSGVGLLKRVQVFVQNEEGFLGLINLPNKVTKVLLDMGIIDHFPRFSSLQAALQQVG